MWIDNGGGVHDAEDRTEPRILTSGEKVKEVLTTANPTLTEEHIAFLGTYGRTRKTEAGEVLFGAGDTSYEFMAKHAPVPLI